MDIERIELGCLLLLQGDRDHSQSGGSAVARHRETFESNRGKDFRVASLAKRQPAVGGDEIYAGRRSKLRGGFLAGYVGDR